MIMYTFVFDFLLTLFLQVEVFRVVYGLSHCWMQILQELYNFPAKLIQRRKFQSVDD